VARKQVAHPVVAKDVTVVPELLDNGRGAQFEKASIETMVFNNSEQKERQR
jgi:hypothetical protein